MVYQQNLAIWLLLGIVLLLVPAQGAQYTFCNATESTMFYDYANDVILSSYGDNFVVGTTDGPLFGPGNGSTDAFIATYFPLNGTLYRWNAIQIATPLTDAAYGVAFSSSSQNILYVAGTYANYPWVGFFDYYLNTLYNYLQLSTPATNGNIGQFSDVAAVPGGVIAVGSAYVNSASRWDGFLVKISDNTTVIWSRNITNYSVDDYLNAVTFLASSNRVFVGGQTAVSGAGKEFYLAEISNTYGVVMNQAVWPGTTCSGFSDRDQTITDVAVDNSGVYFLGQSTQEFTPSGQTTICGVTTAMVYGKFPLYNLNQTIWIYNVSRMADQFTVEGNKFSLGTNGLLYIAGDSDADVLFGQPNSTPGGYLFDWFYYIVNATTGRYADFSFEGNSNTDEFGSAIATGSTSFMNQTGTFSLTVNSNNFATKADFSVYYAVPQLPSASPSAIPSRTPTPSRTPSPSSSSSSTPSSYPSSSPSSSPLPSSSSSSTPSTSSVPLPSASSSPTPNPPQPSSGVYILLIVIGFLLGVIVGFYLFSKVRAKQQQQAQYVPLTPYGAAPPGLVPMPMYAPLNQ